MRKRMVVWLLAGGAGVALLYLWLRPRPLAVELATVDRGEVVAELRAEGKTRARTGTHEEVSAPFAGAWSPMPLEVGDRVARGAVLGRLAPVPLDGAAAEAARSRVQAAEVRWTERRDALTRGQRLFDSGALATETLEHLRAEEVAAAGELAAARAALGGGRRITVRSPLAGQVLRAPEPHARSVPAGTLLLEIGDPKALDVLVDLRTADAVTLHPGTRATLRVSPDTPPIAATVQRVEPSAFTEVSPLGIEEQRVNVVLAFDRPPSGLGVGWRVDVTLVAGEASGVVRLPVAALVRQGSDWAVWVAEGGRAHLRPVSLGLMGSDLVEVRTGLGPGAVVILRPEDAVVEGRRVTRPPE